MSVLTFINIWCIMLFFTFAIGKHKEENPAVTDYAAAPGRPNWRRRLMINTLLSLATTAILALIIHSGLIQVKEISDVQS